MCRNHKCGVLFNDRPQNDPLAQKCWFKKQLISKAKSFLKSNFDLYKSKIQNTIIAQNH